MWSRLCQEGTSISIVSKLGCCDCVFISHMSFVHQAKEGELPVAWILCHVCPDYIWLRSGPVLALVWPASASASASDLLLWLWRFGRLLKWKQRGPCSGRKESPQGYVDTNHYSKQLSVLVFNDMSMTYVFRGFESEEFQSHSHCISLQPAPLSPMLCLLCVQPKSSFCTLPACQHIWF